MTTTTDHELAGDLTATYHAALPLSESVRLADPALIAQHDALLAWPAEIKKWRMASFDERFGRKPPTAPLYNGKGLGSGQFVQRATRAAHDDVWRDTRASLDDGRMVVIGHQTPRRLGDAPVQVLAALVKAAKVINWRSGKVEAGAMTFVECKVVPATHLAAAMAGKSGEVIPLRPDRKPEIA